MPTLKRFGYRSVATVPQKQTYSTEPTEVYQVGYSLVYKIGEAVFTEVLYFASKKQQNAATLACMQRHKNCVVQSVLYL